MCKGANRTKQSRGRPLRRLTVAAFMVFLALHSPAVATAASTSLQVSATIKPWLRYTAVPLVASYQVDTTAIRRGYVDLPASLAIEMATNVRENILLALTGSGPETILVLNGNSPDPGVLSLNALASHIPVARSYDLRILLPPECSEGVYPLHFQVSAAML